MNYVLQHPAFASSDTGKCFVKIKGPLSSLTGTIINYSSALHHIAVERISECLDCATKTFTSNY